MTRRKVKGRMTKDSQDGDRQDAGVTVRLGRVMRLCAGSSWWSFVSRPLPLNSTRFRPRDGSVKMRTENRLQATVTGMVEFQAMKVRLENRRAIHLIIRVLETIPKNCKISFFVFPIFYFLHIYEFFVKFSPKKVSK